ncbi:MAG TPA: B-box zinc finger protein [Syntrophales bacterium]|nr:B-box zinc finger protein [Syntrophales bacterium]HQJ30222.1 B-box zinc finger protein [Syntrophales bacterium]
MKVITNETTPCQHCGALPAVIYCDGCQAPLCVSCRTFDLWGYGCGHVDTKAFCHRCLRDPAVNPYSGFPSE